MRNNSITTYFRWAKRKTWTTQTNKQTNGSKELVPWKKAIINSTIQQSMPSPFCPKPVSLAPCMIVGWDCFWLLLCFKSCLYFLGDSSFLPTELNCKGIFLVGASEKQNMLCTEDESMIKNVSRGAGRGRGRGRERETEGESIVSNKV